VVATLSDPGPKGLDDLTIDSNGILYVAANLTGEVIRVDPASGKHCVIASGMQNTSSLKFGRGPGWRADSLYVTGFDGIVRELAPPAGGVVGPPVVAPFLAVSVRPRTAVAGKRTRFRFTVYAVEDGKRRRLTHARVRLGGKGATTNSRGRAGLTLRFRHAGRKVARAGKSGFSPARKTVRVRSN
jgi:hypothetical protein